VWQVEKTPLQLHLSMQRGFVAATDLLHLASNVDVEKSDAIEATHAVDALVPSAIAFIP
jgi:hypothetical protein